MSGKIKVDQKIIACEVMKDELLFIGANKYAEIEFLSMGLHLHPEKLNIELQKRINNSTGYERIILGFGLCGGAARNLYSETSILTIPKAHDCIPVLLGSHKAFEEQKAKEQGTFYFSSGWFKGEKNILSEQQRLTEKYGEIKAKSLVKRIYSSYKRVLYIKHEVAEIEKWLGKCREISELLGIPLDIVDGRLIYLIQLARGPWSDSNFINKDPGLLLVDEDFNNIIDKSLSIK